MPVSSPPRTAKMQPEGNDEGGAVAALLGNLAKAVSDLQLEVGGLRGEVRELREEKRVREEWFSRVVTPTGGEFEERGPTPFT